MSFLHTLAGIRSEFFDLLFGALTYLGSEMIVIVVIAAIFWCGNKKTAYGMALGFFASGMLVQDMKITFRIDRPWVLDPNFLPVESAVEEATGYSFPSGHTQGATALWSYLAYGCRKKWAGLLCFVPPIVVAFTRMYLGVHTPMDVGVSFALTALVSLAVFLYIRSYGDDSSKDLFISAAMAVISIGVLIHALYLLNAVPIDAKYVSDCAKTAGAGTALALGWFVERRYIKFDTHTKHKLTQIVKVAVGLGIALLFKEIPKLIATGIPMDFIRYLLTVAWVLIVYPYIFDKIVKKYNL